MKHTASGAPLVGALALMPPDDDEMMTTKPAIPMGRRPAPRPLAPEHVLSENELMDMVTEKLPPAPPRPTRPSRPPAHAPTPPPGVLPNAPGIAALESIPVDMPERKAAEPPRPKATSPNGPIVRRARRRTRRLSSLTIIILAVVLVGGVASLYASVLARSGGAPPPNPTVPTEAVRRFYTALLGGKAMSALSLVHPRHRGTARLAVARLLSEKLSEAEVARQAAHAMGRGKVQLEIGDATLAAPNLWRIEVVLLSGGSPLREEWIPVSQDHGSWFVDANPFTEVEEARKLVATSELALSTHSLPPLPPLPPVPLARTTARAPNHR
jgi:hypothetical protein